MLRLKLLKDTSIITVKLEVIQVSQFFHQLSSLLARDVKLDLWVLGDRRIEQGNQILKDVCPIREVRGTLGMQHSICRQIISGDVRENYRINLRVQGTSYIDTGHILTSQYQHVVQEWL